MPKMTVSMRAGGREDGLGRGASAHLLAEVGVGHRHGEERDRYCDKGGVVHGLTSLARAPAGPERERRRYSCVVMAAIVPSPSPSTQLITRQKPLRNH